nr:hypothetical protein [Tanacetum cinerariifolium]
METYEISEQYIAPCFMNGLVAYDEPDLLEDDYEKTRKSSDDWDQLFDFNFDDVPKFGEELPLFIYKMGKSNRNKKRTMENLNLFYQDIRPSSSARSYLTREEEEKEKDKMELDGKTMKEEEDAVKRIKGGALKEKIIMVHSYFLSVSFLGLLHVPLKQVSWKPDYKGSYTKEEEATGQ